MPCDSTYQDESYADATFSKYACHERPKDKETREGVVPGRERGLWLVLFHSVRSAAGVEGFQLLACQRLPMAQLQLSASGAAQQPRLADIARQAPACTRPIHSAL